jgi:hypothetical protein
MIFFTFSTISVTSSLTPGTVENARDLDGGRGGAGQRGKKNSAQGVAERGAVSPLQRLYDILTVGDVILGIDTLDTRLFNFYHE